MSDTAVSQPIVCTICDKPFETKLQLQGHMTSHATPQPCPECGKEYKTPGAMGNHRKNSHGIVSQDAVDRARRVPRKPKLDMDWRVDDIFQTVVTLLWPGGAIPTGAILPLIQWRDDTQVMLEKIQHG